MSLRALSWVARQRAGRAKSALWALGFLADDSGYCFPSFAYLAFVCEISESTVRRMIGELVARKLLTVEHRFDESGGRRSNGYRLAIDPPVKLTVAPSTVAGGGISPVTGGRCRGDTLTTTKPVVYEQLLPVADVNATAGVRAGDKHGGELCFPKAMSDAQRHELEPHIRELSHQQAQDVLDEIAGRMTVTEVHNPVGYGAELVRRAKSGKFQRQVGLKVAARRAAEQEHEARLRNSRATLSSPSSGSPGRLSKRLRASLEAIRPRSMADADPGHSEDGSSSD